VLPYIENGCRVLCFVSSDEILETGDPAPKLPTKTTLEAVLIFKDELRNGVGEMLNQFHEEGVEIKIISGDNPQAVASLFKQVVANSPLSGVSAKFISGLELANLEQGEFAFAVSQNTIFGRITPEQKERIVETLQSMGRFVAMTGDGVNDILSLKKANLGIAMNSGSQATRQLADLVLLDDNLGSLLDVLQEGKRIKASLNNIFQLYLSRSLFLVLIIVYSAIIRLPFPFTIKQSSILAIISTGIPSIGLTLWSQAISENTKNTNPKNINSKNNLGSKLHQSIREFVLPAGISMSLVGGVLYLVVVSFSQQYKMASNPVVAGQTALVVFGAMCCLVLCNVIFTNKKIQILTLWLGIIAVCLPLTRFGAVWNLDTARLLPVGISAVFVLAWMPIFWFGRKIMKG
jgi:cation-transporting ATPase E